MEEFEEAKKCFNSGRKLDAKRSANYELWIRKCDAELEEEENEENGITETPVPEITPPPPTPPVTKYRQNTYSLFCT